MLGRKGGVGMELHAGSWLLVVLTGVLVALAAPAAAQAAGFGFEKWFAGNCGAAFEKCGEGAKEGTKAEAEVEGYRQAGGYTPFGVSEFIVSNFEAGGVKFPN